jgi:sporulation-control protein spo0M
VGGGELKGELAQGIGAAGADKVIEEEIFVPGFNLQAGEAVVIVGVENVAGDCEGSLRHNVGLLIGFRVKYHEKLDNKRNKKRFLF